jgi:hypothetical protein
VNHGSQGSRGRAGSKTSSLFLSLLSTDFLLDWLLEPSLNSLGPVLVEMLVGDYYIFPDMETEENNSKETKNRSNKKQKEMKERE